MPGICKAQYAQSEVEVRDHQYNSTIVPGFAPSHEAIGLLTLCMSLFNRMSRGFARSFCGD